MNDETYARGNLVPARLPRLRELYELRTWLLAQLEPATTALNAASYRPRQETERQTLGVHVQQLAMMLAEVEDALDATPTGSRSV